MHYWATRYAYPEEMQALHPLASEVAEHDGISPFEASYYLDNVRYRGTVDVEDYDAGRGAYVIAFPFYFPDTEGTIEIIWFIDDEWYWKFAGVRYSVLDEVICEPGTEDDKCYLAEYPDSDCTMMGTYIFHAKDDKYELKIDEAPF